MPRVLFLTDSLRCGGKERQLVELAVGLVRTSRLPAKDIVVLSMSPPAYFDPKLEGAGIHIDHLLRRWRWDLFVIHKLGRMLESFRPDVLHSFSLMTSVYAALATRPPGSAFVDGSIRDAMPLAGPKFKALHGLVFRAADLVVANSVAGLEAKAAPRSKSAVLFNGFDFGRLEGLVPPEEVKAHLSIPPGPVVGMVAGFSKFKDWDTFFEGARLVGERELGANFVAVGGGETLRHYRERFAVMPHVFFTGPREDVETVVQVFDIGVLCSHVEGFPNAVMEYMALGKPVVATDGGGIRELILDGETGFIVPGGRPDLVAEKVLWLLKDPGASKSMGEKGRRRIEQHFSRDMALDKLLSLYEGALAGGRAVADKSERVRN